MNPRVKEAILWGVIGLLSFLVLLQGYELLQDVRVDLTVKAGMALVVFVATTVITYVASGHVSPREDGATAETTTTEGWDDDLERDELERDEPERDDSPKDETETDHEDKAE